MPYGKVNPTGCTERYGLIQVRLDLCLEQGDARYDDLRFYQIDETSKAALKGYPGKLDEEGSPIDLEAYAKWEASLPRIWLPERCFHHHFIYLDPYTLKDEQITDAIGLHLPNFYKAWIDEWDNSQGGMRHGWDTATRIRPTRFDKTQPELYEARKAECLAKTDILKMSSFTTQVKGTGETFPATDIDVGSAATNLNSEIQLRSTSAYRTCVDQNNPANATGTIDTTETFFSLANAGNEVKVGTFSFSGATGTCRDAQSIGEVAAGSKQTHTGLDIDVNSGDYIGIDARTNYALRIEFTAGSGDGVWYQTGQFCDATDSTDFTEYANGHISLYGTGETAVVIPSVTTQAATLVDTTSCQGNGNITATGGTNCTRRGFCYRAGTSGDPTTADSVVYDDGSFGAGAFSKAITGLSPDTGYRVRAYAVNTAGVGYGSTVQVTTVGVYAADAIRRISKVSVYTADSTRPLRSVQSYGADATRALQALQSYGADALRMLCAEDSYAADTLRVVLLTLNDIYPADTRRQIQTTDSYSADALRALLATQSYSADSRRSSAEAGVYTADTFRLVRAEASYHADALRAMLGWQTYGADAVRRIHEDLHDRYPADTKRLIYIVQPFIGRPFVLEVRNQSGQLLAIPRLLSGELTRALNAPDVLRATIPADDPAREYINPSNLLYVRDDSGTIVSICSPVIGESESR